MAARNDDGLYAKARSLFISKATMDDFTGWATPRQTDAVYRLFDTELANRERSKRERLLRRARFPVVKSLDGYDFSNVRLPDGYALDGLLDLDFVPRAQDLVFYGRTGRGKTHLAIGLGMRAVERGLNVRFHQTAELVLQLGKAKRDGALDSLLRDLARADLIILDEFGYAPVRLDGARLLYQIIAGSYERRSIILRHEHRVQQMGDDLRRRQTRRRDHRPHRPPRTPHRIHRPQPTRQPSPHVRQDGQPVRQTTGRHSSCRKPKKISDETRNTDLTKYTLLCELHGVHVSEGRVEPLVVVPPYVPVGVRAQSFHARVDVVAYGFLLDEPVGGFDHRVVVGAAGIRQETRDAEHVEHSFDAFPGELAAPVGVEHLDVA